MSSVWSRGFPRRVAGQMGTAAVIACIGDGACQLIEGVDASTTLHIHEPKAWKVDRTDLARDYGEILPQPEPPTLPPPPLLTHPLTRSTPFPLPPSSPPSPDAGRAARMVTYRVFQAPIVDAAWRQFDYMAASRSLVGWRGVAYKVFLDQVRTAALSPSLPLSLSPSRPLALSPSRSLALSPSRPLALSPPPAPPISLTFPCPSSKALMHASSHGRILHWDGPHGAT